MADPNNALCAGNTVYCAPLGSCVQGGCPEQSFLPNITGRSCFELGKLKCLAKANSFEAGACLRAVHGAFQDAGAMTPDQLSDMLYFPEAYAEGRAAGRKCLSGVGPQSW